MDKFLQMAPMKYTGGSAFKKHVDRFFDDINSFDGWFSTIKVDGEWCRIVYDLEGNVTVQGRGISRVTKTYKDNTENVPHIVQDVKNNFPLGTVLVGELAFEDFHRTVQTEVGSILRCKAPKAIERQKGNPLHLYVFDVLAFDGIEYVDEPYVNRTVEHDGSSFVHFVKRYPVTAATIEYLEKVLSRGEEGIMLMNGATRYLPGSRSITASLKIKKELNEVTLKVVGTVAPSVKYDGTELSAWEYFIDGEPVTKRHYLGWETGVIVEYKDNLVRITSGTSDEDAKWLASDEAKQMIDNGELYADVIAMDEFETNGKKSLRHPVLLKIRTDLGAKEVNNE